jgi:hypothetical protein
MSDDRNILVCSPWEDRRPEVTVVCKNCCQCRRVICVDAGNIPVVEEQHLELWCLECWIPEARKQRAAGEEMNLRGRLTGGKEIGLKIGVENHIRRLLGLE